MGVARANSIELGFTRLTSPAFFPSISTVKTALPPMEYLAALRALRDIKPRFLVSAFDLNRSGDGLSQLLSEAQADGVTVLMDSGNYESYWKEAGHVWRQQDFHAVLKRCPSPLAFAFDEQNPPKDHAAHVDLVVEHWRQDQAAAGNHCSVIPIIHENGENLVNVCVRVAQATQVPMIAVAERQLGDGLIDRTKLVTTLRNALNETGKYIGLHLLGTGNPISIAIYSWAGADSFDGLEWCQTVVDHETAILYHLSQSDFFQSQTKWGDMNLSFHSRTLAHNLTFYSDWMRRLRHAMHEGNEIEFFRFNFPERVFQRCTEAFNWVKPT